MRIPTRPAPGQEQLRSDDESLDPIAELASLNHRLRGYLDRWDRRPSLLEEQGADGFTPLADVEETTDAYLVEIELPGVRRSDIEVRISGGQLTVTGERKERERAGALRRRSRITGRFHFEVDLPTVDPEAEVAAGYDDGVLTVRVPKPASDGPRRIAVT